MDLHASKRRATARKRIPAAADKKIRDGGSSVAVSVAFYDRDQPQPTGVSSYFINVAPNPAQIDLKTAVIAV